MLSGFSVSPSPSVRTLICNFVTKIIPGLFLIAPISPQKKPVGNTHRQESLLRIPGYTLFGITWCSGLSSSWSCRTEMLKDSSSTPS